MKRRIRPGDRVLLLLDFHVSLRVQLCKGHPAKVLQVHDFHSCTVRFLAHRAKVTISSAALEVDNQERPVDWILEPEPARGCTFFLDAITS